MATNGAIPQLSSQELLQRFRARRQQSTPEPVQQRIEPDPVPRQQIQQQVIPAPVQQLIPQQQAATDPVQQQISQNVQPDTSAQILQRFRQRKAIEQPEVAKPEPSVFEKVQDFFTGGLRKTPETEELPEVLSLGGLNVGDFGDNLKVAAGLLLAVDDQDQMDIIKKAAPETKFTTDSKGNVIGDFKGQRFVLNKPGFSFADAQRAIAQMAAFFPAAKFAQLGRGIAQRAFLGGVAAGQTEALVQEGVRGAGGQQEISPGRIAAAAALGGAAEVLTGGVQAVRQARRASQVGAATAELADVAPQVQEARQLAQETGIPLFQAQQTRVPSQVEKQAFLVQLPASTRKASEALRTQNKAAADAVDNFITSIAPDEAIVTGKERFRTAAQRAVQVKKDARSAKASPLFNKAFGEGTSVDTTPIQTKISELKIDFPESGEVVKTLDRIGGLIGVSEAAPAAVTQGTKESLKALTTKLESGGIKFSTFFNPKSNSIELSKIVVPDTARGSGQGTKAMKDLIKIADGNGSTITLTPSKDFGGGIVRLRKFYKGLGFVENKGRNKDFRFTDTFLKLPGEAPPVKVPRGKPNLKRLHNAKLEIDQLLAKFGENSLGNTTKRQVVDIKNTLLEQMDEASPLYREAREEFARLSPGVDALQESIIGKVADLGDVQLETVSKKIFNPDFSPKTIRDAKKVIDAVDPDAWNELVRVEFAGRLSKMKADISEAGATTENIPGQMFRAIFGNAKQKAVLFNSVDGELAKNLKYLEKGLERASIGRVAGSQTAIREEIKRELRGGVGATIRDIFSKPVSTLVSVGDDAAFNRRVRGLAEVMFNPNWRPQMRQLRKLNPNSPAAARALTQLLNDVDKTIEEQ